MTRVLCISGLGAALLGVLMLSSVAKSAEATRQALMYLPGDANRLIAVNALDDPANPYRDEYGPVDRWVYEHYDAAGLSKPKSLHLRGAMLGIAQSERPVDLWVAAEVDAQGWLIPASFFSDHRFSGSCAESLEQFLQHDGNVLPVGKAFMPARGSFPPELWPELLRKRWKSEAGFVPPIPAWLVQHPPMLTVMLPQGMFFCMGEMGAQVYHDGYPEAGVMPQGLRDSELWYLYDSEGQLLHTGAGPMGLYDGMREMLTGKRYTPYIMNSPDYVDLPPGQQYYSGLLFKAVVEQRDLHSSVDQPSTRRKVYSAMDAYGEPIDLQAPMGILSPSLMGGLTAGELVALYQEQLAQGLTTADSLSPYAGKPDGPQVAASFEPRPRHRLASPSGMFNLMGEDERRVVKPLETEGNPYRQQYSRWDRWIWDNFNARDLSQGVTFDSEGKAIEKEAPPGTWVRLEAFVDRDGYLVPFLQSVVLDEQRWHAGTLAEKEKVQGRLQGYYRLGGGARLSDDELNRLNSDVWPLVKNFYPNIPDWLVQRPVGFALFQPNGEVVTRGYLGCWQPFIEQVDLTVLVPTIRDLQFSRSLEEQAVETVTARYSPQGELLSEMPYDINTDRGQIPTQAVYDSSMLVRAQEAEALNYTWNRISGYLLWSDKSSSEPVAAYDFDASPVDPAALESRPHVRWLQWPEIWAVWNLQQQFGE